MKQILILEDNELTRNKLIRLIESISMYLPFRMKKRLLVVP